MRLALEDGFSLLGSFKFQMKNTVEADGRLTIYFLIRCESESLTPEIELKQRLQLEIDYDVY